jgi:3-oxoacyl-[acyl-carrier protein] reductase
MPILLNDRVAVVTGAAQGIGLEVARNLAEHGASVLLIDRDEQSLLAAAESLAADGLKVGTAVVNVADIDEFRAAIELATATLGRVSILVNNAGIVRDRTMKSMTVDEFDAVIEVNLKGAWIGTKLGADAMTAGGGGAIINISSIAGKVGTFGQTNYCAAKAGIVGLTKSAAKELAAKGVRINAVQPGMIMTPMLAAVPQEVLDQKVSEIPMRRVGQPQDIANAVTFLASDMASYITGEILEVTGGRFM